MPTTILQTRFAATDLPRDHLKALRTDLWRSPDPDVSVLSDLCDSPKQTFSFEYPERHPQRVRHAQQPRCQMGGDELGRD